ncbi:GlcNAc-PI de-N-acetylase [Krasilnikovia cinnamomea]|uniref:GlcNAc-PI de-N-acetylase n=1 Tax=Krasilnikovia cinnamomea TaxID=349313 RepID=A0A4Q7ZU75_9ACTN|nr:PIG-L family deacetylase [Krasilnikovia cinnamomea]RZU54451.1 GlcNAc-PI de-N-acetylase [Krasilnikovia cinnamomea]
MRAAISRRSLIIGSALGGAAAVTGLGVALGHRRSAPAGDDDPVVPVPANQVHVIAHPDDDLYFLSPDLFRAIDGAGRLVTICLTGAEADGKNVLDGDPAAATTPVRFPEYVAARYNGLRAAYARRATGDPASPWDHTRLVLASGAVAELCTLRAAPRIQLILLNMWQDGGRAPGGRPARLRTLWTGETDEQPVITVPGSAATGARPYTRASLLKTLVELLDRYQPTLVRTLDPDPDHQVHDADRPQYSDFGDFSDHIDHTPAGLFAWAALQQWCAAGPRRVLVESYRGYYNRRWPVNLSRAETLEKLTYVTTYGGGDGRRCDIPAGCGDYKVGKPVSMVGYGQGTHHRYAVGASWLTRGADGRLAAFGVVGTRAAVWTEGAGGNWSRPQVLDGAGLVPYTAAAQSPDGRWHIFGVRMTLAATDRAQRRDLVTAAQVEPGGTFGPWTSLGNPADTPGADPIRRRGIGMPVVAVNQDGRVQVFVRNFFGGVCTRALSATGGWGAWTDLRGSDTQDGLAAVTTKGGRIQLFASTHEGIRTWLQRKAGGAGFKQDRLDVPAPAGPPTVVRLPDGRLVLLVRQAHTSNVLAYLQQGAKREWNTEPIDLGGHGGYGPLSAVAYGDDMLAISQRNDEGRTSLTLRYTADLADGQWKRTGPQLVHAPSVGVDASGALVLGAFTADGGLWTARQDGTGATMALQAWRSV